MSLEEAMLVGAQRAYVASQGMNQGHLPSVVGHMRHFHMNEAFYLALDIGGALPSPLRGNKIVTGKAGIFTLARFNTKYGDWNKGRRSEMRKQISRVNAAIEPLVQPGLFSDYVEPSEAVAFIVACFSESVGNHAMIPASIEIAVPDQHMRGWLFREPVQEFIKRYDPPLTIGQQDLAVPKLKKYIETQEVKDGTKS